MMDSVFSLQRTTRSSETARIVDEHFVVMLHTDSRALSDLEQGVRVSSVEMNIRERTESSSSVLLHDQIHSSFRFETVDNLEVPRADELLRKNNELSHL